MKRYPRVLVATACIPWNERYEFDASLFRLEIQNTVASGIKHIYLFGSAGEGYALTDRQYAEIVRVFAEEMRDPSLHPMIGLVGTAMAQMRERQQFAYELGIREFQLALPCWGALNDRELETFFHGMCDDYPDCRYMHYNISRSRRVLGIRDYLHLAEEIPNLAAAKISSKDASYIFDLITAPCPIQFFLMDLAYAYASLLGECSYLVAIPAINARIAQQYLDAGIAQDTQTLFRIEREVGAIRQKLLDLVGLQAIDGAYDKMNVKIVMPEFPLRLLPPYEYPTEENFEAYRDYLQIQHPRWLSHC